MGRKFSRRTLLLGSLLLLSGQIQARGGRGGRSSRGGGRGGRGGSGTGFFWFLGIGGVIFGLVKLDSWKTARRKAHDKALEEARLAEVERLKPPKAEWETLGLCLLCGSPMTVRTAKVGRRRGTKFMGCTSYPRCEGVRKVTPKARGH
ncbi:topoisomerase DNA-binding C4 zinc finger domain-containing protein [Pseudomonas rhodesiae]|uniref:topoisomerase DNA-binding C4 zinc finger domain-containing protein n=1 Tax=Pseudomonas rhodesiae TaxID=76760 RepID=UPI003D6D326F